MTTTTATRPLVLPSAAVLVGGVYVLSVLGNAVYALGQIAFTDIDPHQNDGPIESILGVGIAGTIALALAVGVGMALRGSPERDRAAAIILVVLAVPAVIAFWSGAPAILGAAAAWKAGLTRGSTPLGGSARVAGLIGLFLAVADLVLIAVALAAA